MKRALPKAGRVAEKTQKLREFVGFVEFDVWKFRVRVLLTNDLPASARKMDRDAKETESTVGMVLRSETHPNHCCVVLRYDVNEGTVAHEAWHAVRRLMLYAGAEPENETIAYHLGYLVNKIYRIRRRAKKLFFKANS